MGKSDRASQAHTSQDMVDDLHALLANAGIRPPYVLVGHSFGGMNARLYASKYPKAVAGMVLVDSTHEDEKVRGRPKLFTIDTEMQRWCALLDQELSAWPDVSAKPMFGMTGFYHGKSIFAAIPKTKAPHTARSLLIKLPKVKDRRLKRRHGSDSDWVTFELASLNDVTEALMWIERAYQQFGLEDQFSG